MNLVVHQVVELQHVHVPDGHRMPDGFAGAPIEQHGLPAGGQFRFLQQILDLALGSPVEHGAGDVEPQGPGGPPQVRLKNLPDVHTGGHAERIQHDFHRRPVRQEGHVLLGQHAGHDALVAVATGHLVADRDLALHRDIDLDELDDAGRQLVAALQPAHLVVVHRLKDFGLLLGGALQILELLLLVRIAEDDVADVVVRQLLQNVGG